MQQPRVLHNFSLAINGVSQNGIARTITIPEFVIKTYEQRNAGMDMPEEIDDGMEVLVSEIELSEYSPFLIATFGASGNAAAMTLRGFARGGGRSIAHLIHMYGLVKMHNYGTWQAGNAEEAVLRLSISCKIYHWFMDGVPVVNIDVYNALRAFGGVNQLAGQNAALGI